MKYLLSLVLLVLSVPVANATHLPYDIHYNFKVSDGNMTKAFENLTELLGRKLELEEVGFGRDMADRPSVSVRIKITYDYHNEYSEYGCGGNEESYTTLEGMGETIEEALWDFYIKVKLSNLAARNW